MEGSYKLIPSNEKNFDALDPILSQDDNAHVIGDVKLFFFVFLPL